MASTPALIGPKSCVEASRLIDAPSLSDASDRPIPPSLDFIASRKPTLRLREINERPLSTITRARITFRDFLNNAAPRWVDE